MTYKWNLSDIYENELLYNEDLDKIKNFYTPKLSTYEGKLSCFDTLIEFLKLKDEATRISSKLYTFAKMSKDEDLSDPKKSERLTILNENLANLSTSYSYYLPEILSFEDEKLNQILSDERFSSYKRFFKRLIEEKKHILSKEEEALLSQFNFLFSLPYDSYNSLKMVDIKYPTIDTPEGEKIQISFGTYNQIRTHKDRQYRMRAFDALYGSLYKYKNSLSLSLSYEVQKNVALSKIRKFDSALDRGLFNYEVPRKVYDNLLYGTKESLSILHKYISLRKKVLKLDKVMPHDIGVSLSFSLDKKYTYEEAYKLSEKYLSIFGDEYINVLDKAINEGWIDVYEAPHKAPGGYQSGAYDTHPYILLNYDDTYSSLSTLAHELGHALNAYFCHKNCDYPNHRISAFNAEVASITNEIILVKGLIKDSKDEIEKLHFLNKYADLLRNTAFTQVMYSEFEKLIHEEVEDGKALSCQKISEIWLDINKKYYGPDFENSFYNSIGWAYILHFYLNFYTFNYALSICAANKVANNILDGNVSDYIRYLSSGGVDDPIKTIAKLGIDMENKEVVLDLYKDFEKTINQMEEILKNQGKI